MYQRDKQGPEGWTAQVGVSRAQRGRRGYRMRLDMEAEPADGSTCGVFLFNTFQALGSRGGGEGGVLVWGEEAIKREE